MKDCPVCYRTLATGVTAGTDTGRRSDDPAAAGGGAAGPPSSGRRQETAAAPPRPTPDTTAVAQELRDLIERMDDPERRPTAIARAAAIYEESRLPAPQRASAATLVAFGHVTDADRTGACRWMGRARALEPANGTYRSLETRWGGAP